MWHLIWFLTPRTTFRHGFARTPDTDVEEGCFGSAVAAYEVAMWVHGECCGRSNVETQPQESKNCNDDRVV